MSVKDPNSDKIVIRKLHIEEAPEPTDVFWENLRVTSRSKFFTRILL